MMDLQGQFWNIDFGLGLGLINENIGLLINENIGFGLINENIGL